MSKESEGIFDDMQDGPPGSLIHRIITPDLLSGSPSAIKSSAGILILMASWRMASHRRRIKGEFAIRELRSGWSSWRLGFRLIRFSIESKSEWSDSTSS